jgi:hypothetical protein
MNRLLPLAILSGSFDEKPRKTGHPVGSYTPLPHRLPRMGWKDALKDLLEAPSKPPISPQERADPVGTVREMQRALPASRIRALTDPAKRSAALRALNEQPGGYGKFLTRYIDPAIGNYIRGLALVRMMAEATSGAQRGSEAARAGSVAHEGGAAALRQRASPAARCPRPPRRSRPTTGPPWSATATKSSRSTARGNTRSYCGRSPRRRGRRSRTCCMYSALLLVFCAQAPATAADTAAHVRHVGGREILSGELSILGEMKELFFDTVGLRTRITEGAKGAEGKGRRESIPERVRHEVWRRDQAACVDCGGKEHLEFDHIIPLSRGGANTARNLELRCQSCHDHKHRRRENV